MSQFKRTTADLDEASKTLSHLKTTPTTPIPQRKQILDQLITQLKTIRSTTDKFISKADIGERDPNKRIYGKAMVERVRELGKRLEGVEGELKEVEEGVLKEYGKWEEEEREKKRREEEERLEKERMEKERLEREEQERLKKEKEEKERMEREEKERLEKLRLEEERKKREEEERKRKVEEEKERKRKQAEEDERKRVEMEKEQERKKEEARAKGGSASGAAASGANASGPSISVKTASGESFSLPLPSFDISVEELRKTIEKARDVPPEAQRLIYSGKLLGVSEKLSHYKIDQGSVVHLVTKGYKAKPVQGKKEEKKGEEIKPVVAPGTVHHVKRGQEELLEILKSCGKRRLAIVDWSAPWCGP